MIAMRFMTPYLTFYRVNVNPELKNYVTTGECDQSLPATIVPKYTVN